MKIVSNLISINFLVLLFLNSCETVERTQATNVCKQIAFQKIPVKNQSYACQDYVCNVVKTGEKCTTRCALLDVGSGACSKFETICEDTTKRDCKYVNKTCIGDVNKTLRTNWIFNCANNACLDTYGNIHCEK